MSRLLLDTSFLVDADRSKASFDGQARSSELGLIDDEDKVAAAAITVAELLVGVFLADDTHRAHRRQFVDEVKETIPIID